MRNTKDTTGFEYVQRLEWIEAGDVMRWKMMKVDAQRCRQAPEGHSFSVHGEVRRCAFCRKKVKGKE